MDAADNGSIFADKKIIEVRLDNASVGTEGAKTLSRYCERVPNDALLIVTCSKVTKDALKAKWLQAIDKIGVVLQVWPLEGADLIRWLQQRLHQRGLTVSPADVAWLASRVEGNLLAAAQEVDKLYMLYGQGSLNATQLHDAVADYARYDVFKLMDSLLAANAKRGLKILSALKADGIAPPIIIWALVRDARILSHLVAALAQGQSLDMALKNQHIWDKRRALMTTAVRRLNSLAIYDILQQCAKADRQSKGQQSGDVWDTLMTLCLHFAAMTVLPTTR
jgi:DNA polymerase-3 subunit delta